jgi:hypothetical protein
MKASNSTSGHSADVRLHLFINGHVLPIAQLGPDFLVLRTPADYPPSDGEIHMVIDGQASRWPVRLADGIKADQRKTAIAGGENGSTVG